MGAPPASSATYLGQMHATVDALAAVGTEVELSPSTSRSSALRGSRASSNGRLRRGLGCRSPPIHDHLAWGLVRLYRGIQEEEIFAWTETGFELAERRVLIPGDFYALILPTDDIHRVRTTFSETSVSIHLLTNDTGCVWRHAYDANSGQVRACVDDGRESQARPYSPEAESTPSLLSMHSSSWW
jgi:hypothetical protein